MAAIALAYGGSPFGCGGNTGICTLSCNPLQIAAEADGTTSPAATGPQLSPLQMVYTPDPYGTGANVSAALHCNPLQIGADVQQATMPAAVSLILKGGLGANTGTGTQPAGQLGGRLAITAEADGATSTTSTAQGGGLPAKLTGGSQTATYAAASTLDTAMPAGTASGSSAATGTLAAKLASSATAAGSTTTAAAMRLQPMALNGSSAGAATTTAAISAKAQLRGLSGPEGWERPQLTAAAAGSASASGTLTITGAPTVQMSGSA